MTETQVVVQVNGGLLGPVALEVPIDPAEVERRRGRPQGGQGVRLWFRAACHQLVAELPQVMARQREIAARLTVREAAAAPATAELVESLDLAGVQVGEAELLEQDAELGRGEAVMGVEPRAAMLEARIRHHSGLASAQRAYQTEAWRELVEIWRAEAFRARALDHVAELEGDLDELEGDQP